MTLTVVMMGSLKSFSSRAKAQVKTRMAHLLRLLVPWMQHMMLQQNQSLELKAQGPC